MTQWGHWVAFFNPRKLWVIVPTSENLYTWATTWQNQQNECAPSEDSDQPGHPPSLIRVFAVGCPGWSESSLCAQWIAKDPSSLLADSKDSDQTGQMPRLIWVFAGCTLTLLVLSCRGLHVHYLGFLLPPGQKITSVVTSHMLCCITLQWEWEKWKYEKDCQVMFYSVVTGKPLRLNRDLTVDGLGEEKDRMGKIP